MIAHQRNAYNGNSAESRRACARHVRVAEDLGQVVGEDLAIKVAEASHLRVTRIHEEDLAPPSGISNCIIEM
jgi:hypothetical protein